MDGGCTPSRQGKEVGFGDERPRQEEEENEELLQQWAESGWVEALTSCPHLTSMATADDLTHIPSPDSPCSVCYHPAENWMCLNCKDVLCSRFINKHMLGHHETTGHCLALSFSDLSVWCFPCEAYLDGQAIVELQPVYEAAHLLKFGERPPFRSQEIFLLGDTQAGSSAPQP